jgi:hypothetical protein
VSHQPALRPAVTHIVAGATRGVTPNSSKRYSHEPEQSTAVRAAWQCHAQTRFLVELAPRATDIPARPRTIRHHERLRSNNRNVADNLATGGPK